MKFLQSNSQQGMKIKGYCLSLSTCTVDAAKCNIMSEESFSTLLM